MFDFLVSSKLRKRRIERPKIEIEPQEVLLDALSQKEALFDQKFEVPLPGKTLRFLIILSILLISSLLLRAFYLQTFKHQELVALAKRNYQRTYFKRSDRGVIYDQNFNQLVFNGLSFDLVAVKEDLPAKKEELGALLGFVAQVTGQTPESLEEKISQTSTSEVLLSQDLDHHALILLEGKIKDLPGLLIQENIKRIYDQGPLFSHLIGFLTRIESEEIKKEPGYSAGDYIGRMGLEKSFEKVLRGESEKILVEKDARSQELSRQTINLPRPGKSLVLWLEADLQRTLSQSLEKALEKAEAGAGVGIVLDAKTGGVLSLVSLPSFDNNLFFQKMEPDLWQKIRQDPLSPFWNRAIAGTYPTGSTIKPLEATAVLEEKIISPEKKILAEGKIEVANPWFPDKPWVFHDWAVHGWTNMRKAIAVSCNVYFYTVGGGFGPIKGLGEARIKKYLSLFGWGQLTGIDLPGERAGLVPDRAWKKGYFSKSEEKIWLPGDTYNLSIGQGYLAVTPLQVASSFLALANNGRLLKPLMVKAIVDENKETLQVFEPEVVREGFVDPENIRVAKEGMREAVLYGSAAMLNDLPVRVAAKTGTAQTAKSGFYHNWVTIFAPYDDPEIVLTLMIENVPGEKMVVLPAAKEVLDWYFTIKEAKTQ